MARDKQLTFLIDTIIWDSIKCLASDDDRKPNDYARKVILDEAKKEVKTIESARQ